MHRRTFMIGAATFASTGPLAASIGRREDAAVEPAILRRVRRLRWTGEATIFTARRKIEIGLSTRVVPFVAARSDSWLLSDGPGKTRSLILDETGGWVERDGRRTPLPELAVRHERAQYGIYGMMLLALSRATNPKKAGAATVPLIIRRPGLPDTTFGMDVDGHLLWAKNTVPKAESAGTQAQRFTFSGLHRSGSVNWPARIEIAQDGSPYFDLRLTHFEASTI